MIGKKYRGESQYGEKVEGWLVRHPLGKVFLIVYKGCGEPRWVEMKEETLEEVPEVEVEFKYNVGDKVRDINNPELVYTVIGQFAENGKPFYNLKGTWGEASSAETWLISVSRDITERIKTFDDACQWCRENNHNGLVEQYYDAMNVGLQRAKDITAYLQLRIIATALNDGWKPKFDGTTTWVVASYDAVNKDIRLEMNTRFLPSPCTLAFKNLDLAQYSVRQFADIHRDFFGAKEGGEE